MKTPRIVFIQNGNETEEINFGVVMAGKTKIIEITVANQGTVDLLDAILETGNPNIKIIASPKIIEMGKKYPLRLEHLSNINDESGVKTFITVKGIYRV